MLLPTCASKSPSLIGRAPQRLLNLTVALRLIALFFFALAVPTLSRSQNVDDVDVIKVTTDLLLFPVRVRDKNKEAVAGLTANDVVLNDQDHVTSRLYFIAGTDRVALVFALDQSGSLRETISKQRYAALALFERFNDRSTVAVLRFSESASIAVPFPGDASKAREGFSFPAQTNAHTAIFDAAQKAIEQFDQLPKVRTERRIVILISDGLDNASKSPPRSVIQTAIDKHVSFYVIHLPLFEPRDGHLAVRTPTKGFRELAEKTGGKYFLVGNARQALTSQETDLGPIFKAIEEDLKSQYLLGFYIAESARDGRQHALSVALRPSGIQYSVGQLDYARTHKFIVNLSREATSEPR